MRGEDQIRIIRGATGLNWKSFGQNVSATIEEVSGGSTVHIIGQIKGPAMMDLGRGKEEVHRLTGILTQNLTTAGWKAHVIRVVHRSPPTWLVILVVLAWLAFFGMLLPAIVEFIDITLSNL